MFREIVKDLYIGKSKLTIECNQKEIPQTTRVQDILQNTGFTGNMPKPLMLAQSGLTGWGQACG